MRHILRAGALALAAGSVLLGGAVAAQAAPAGTVTIKVGRLVLEPAQFGHTGSVQIAIRNRTSEPLGGNIAFTEPVAGTLDGVTGASNCFFGSADGGVRETSTCSLDDQIEPGSTGVLTLHFRAAAKPQAYPQVAPDLGGVAFNGATARFGALFRSTTGSLRNPRPYVQDTTQAFSVSAGDVTLTRQEDGTFAGRVPVTVRNNGDAPHRSLWGAVVTPAGIDPWAGIDPSEVCAGSGNALPIPPGGSGTGCSLTGGVLAEGEERSFEWILTAPEETPAGVLGTGTTVVRFSGPTDSQTDGANVDSFTITVAG